VRAVLATVIALALVAGSVWSVQSCLRTPVEVVDHAGRALERVAAAFRQGTITTSWISHATSLSGTLHLEVAQLKQAEVFARQEEKTTGFGYIPLPEVIVEARAPVDYSYYLDLNEAWRLDVAGEVVQVIAPRLQCSTPAVDASAITYEVRKGFFGTADALEALKRSITSLVQYRARENIPLVRETARRQTETFAARWLASGFSDGHKYVVKVTFADESRVNPPAPLVPNPRE
jgi:hypothetical protein